MNTFVDGEPFYIKRGDTAEPIIITCQYSDGTPIDEDLTGADVEFHMMTFDGDIIVAAGQGYVLPIPDDWPVDQPFKRVGYQWADDGSDTALASQPEHPHQAEFQVTLTPSGRVLTFPNFGNIPVVIYPSIA